MGGAGGEKEGLLLVPARVLAQTRAEGEAIDGGGARREGRPLGEGGVVMSGLAVGLEVSMSDSCVGKGKLGSSTMSEPSSELLSMSRTLSRASLAVRRRAIARVVEKKWY